LTRTLVRQFYQANAGFFLVTLGLVFGFLKTPQHIDIATALAFTPVYYLIPFGLFMLYTAKALQFCFTAQRLHANQFLGWLVLLPKAKRALLIIYLQILLLAPVIAYSLLLLSVAVQHQLWTPALLVTGGNLVLILAGAHLLHKRLISPTDPGTMSATGRWTSKLPKPLSMLFIHHLFNRQAMLLLGTKAVSIAVISGAILIFEMEGSDYRFLTLGMLLSGGINSILSFHYQQFEQKELLIFKNLPVSTNFWFGRFLLSYVLLFLPEVVVLMGNTITRVPVHTILGSALLPVAMLSFYQSILYRKTLDMDGFIKYPFFTTATLFFVILGYAPAYAIAMGLLILSYFIFRISFRQFSPVVKAH
jgi:vacuolar-type H+-ATPase subunit I/STV1